MKYKPLFPRDHNESALKDWGFSEDEDDVPDTMWAGYKPDLFTKFSDNPVSAGSCMLLTFSKVVKVSEHRSGVSSPDFDPIQ